MSDPTDPWKPVLARLPLAAMLLDAEGLIRLWNEAAQALFGWSDKEVVGRHWNFLIPGESRADAEAFWQVLASGQVHHSVHKNRTQDGRVIPCEWHSVPLKDEQGEFIGVLSIVHEATPGFRAFEVLQQVFTHAPIGIALVGLDGRPTMVSEALCRMLGYSSEELTRMRFTEFTHPEDAEADWSLFQELLAGERDSYTMRKRYIREDGGIVHALLSVGVVRDEQGKPLVIVGMAQDITAQVRAEEEAQHHLRHLQARNHILSAILEAADLDERLNRVLDAVLEATGVEMGAIHLVEDDQVVLRAWRGLSDAFRAHVRVFQVAEAPYFMREAEIVRERLSETGRFADFAKRDGVQVRASVPLVLPSGEWLGTLMLASRRYEALPEEDVQMLWDIGRQVALAIHYAHLRQSAEERLRRLTALREIDRAIIQKRSLPEVLQTVLENVPLKMGADAVAASLLDETQTRFQVFLMRLPNGQVVEEPAFDAAESLLHQFVDRQELVIIYDVNQDPRLQMHREAFRNWRLFSYLGVPLIVQGETIGVLHLFTTTPQVFSDEDVAFFRTLAGQAAIALENARLFERLQQSYEDLKRAQEQVIRQERLRALGEMASGIVHDLNNVLSPVIGYAELLLERKDLPPDMRRYLENIMTAAQDASTIVSRLRHFYRQRSPGEPLVPVSLNAMVNETLELTRSRWKDIPQAQGIVVEVRTELGEVPQVMGNPAEIREALTNLVLNAVDAMPEGGILTFRTRLEPPRGVVVEVSDTGIGMDEETKRRCLEPFFSTKGETGTGMGLPMVYGVMQRHEGDLEIESAPGQGTTVRLVFPLPEEVEAEAKVAEALPSLAPLRILCIDDDPGMRGLMKDLLKSDGHFVATAEGGEAGVEAFRTALEARQPFDVVLTDLGMPFMDGLQVARRVKAMSPQTPVILVTGWQGIPSKGAEESVLVDEVLGKPVKIGALRLALHRALVRGGLELALEGHQGYTQRWDRF